MCPIDYSLYPPNWKDEIVPAVLKRADHCCEECGLENGQKVWSVPFNIRKTVNGRSRYTTQKIWFRAKGDAFRASKITPNKPKEVKVVLTVAHLDHDEENWDVTLDRLKAWCQMCHLRYDAKEKFKRVNGSNS